MIESPVLQELIAEVEARARQRSLIAFLLARFRVVPDAIVSRIKVVTDEKQLDELTNAAATVSTLAEFEKHLTR